MKSLFENVPALMDTGGISKFQPGALMFVSQSNSFAGITSFPRQALQRGAPLYTK